MDESEQRGRKRMRKEDGIGEEVPVCYNIILDLHITGRKETRILLNWKNITMKGKERAR